MYGSCRSLFGLGGYGIGTGWIGGLIMFVGLILIGVIIYFIVKSSHTNRFVSNAQTILDERLAKGEIDEDTYQNLSKKIR
jgi:uncharacterized membrane protein